MPKKEKREFPPIPIEWLQKTMMQLVCGPDRKFSSEDTVIIFTLIDLWRKENESIK